MPITVEAHVQYLTAPVEHMRRVDYDGLAFVSALKGRPRPNQWATVRAPDGSWRRIDQQHPEVASEIFAAWAKRQILQRQFQTPICLVPVPNKAALISAVDQPFATLTLAEQVAKQFKRGVRVHAALRWRSELQRAGDGGPRQAWELYPEMAFVAPPSGTSKQVVLVDDVCTSGGHLQACAARLKTNGYIADYAVCGAKTFHEQQPDPFSVFSIQLDDYVPGSNPFGFKDETQ
jgi:hypothetical protein